MAALAEGDAPGDPKPKRSLVFTGFMGAGKSRALRRVRESGGDGDDADLLLESELGMPIPEFFEREGEAEFRRREEALALQVLGEGHEAVSLGGGAVLSEQVREALASHTVVWLRVPPDELWRRASGTERPLARDREEFMRLHAAREHLYADTADAVMLSADAVPQALASLRALAEMPATGERTRLIWAQSASAGYPVWIGAGVLGRAPWPAPGRRAIVTDTAAGGLYRERVEPVDAWVEIDPGEGSKTLANVESVLEQLAKENLSRDDHVVALGGGVVGDLAGFSAAIYQRGVPVVQVPTTLLGQVDSAYGGKTAVDLPDAKNYAGAYHLPAGVIADTTTLASLPREELAAGFVEVLKTGLLAGGEAWQRARSLEELDPAALEEIVFDCALFKLEVVAADERDSDRREVLNLGHTVGHAIEAASGYGRYRHGEAVGLGLLAALRLSDAQELRTEARGLLERHGLPTSLDASVETDEILEALRRDKKADVQGPRFVLLAHPGEPVTGARIEAARVRDAVEELR